MHAVKGMFRMGWRDLDTDKLLTAAHTGRGDELTIPKPTAFNSEPHFEAARLAAEQQLIKSWSPPVRWTRGSARVSRFLCRRVVHLIQRSWWRLTRTAHFRLSWAGLGAGRGQMKMV